MTHDKSASEDGFSIVELLVVLAIVSIILMLVLLAIPALQRSSRNNARRQDVQSILQEVSHWELNNSGDIPTTANLRTQLNAPNKIINYTPSSVSVAFSGLGSSTGINNVNNLDTVVIYNHAKCDTNNPGSGTPAGAGYNDVVAMFAIETTTSGISSQCQQL